MIDINKMENNLIDREDAVNSFKKAMIAYFITFNKKGEMHSRPMTNFNDNPYGVIWFPSYNNTRKVGDIKQNKRTLILYPAIEEGKFYEIEGKAELGTRSEVEEKWVWWYLYWHPEMNDYFWFDQTGKHPERVIINVHPENIKKLDKSDVKLIKDTYATLVPIK